MCTNEILRRVPQAKMYKSSFENTKTCIQCHNASTSTKNSENYFLEKFGFGMTENAHQLAQKKVKYIISLLNHFVLFSNWELSTPSEKLEVA